MSRVCGSPNCTTKPWHDAVHAQAVVEVAAHERQDVLDRLGRFVRIHLDLEAFPSTSRDDDGRTGRRLRHRAATTGSLALRASPSADRRPARRRRTASPIVSAVMRQRRRSTVSSLHQPSCVSGRPVRTNPIRGHRRAITHSPHRGDTGRQTFWPHVTRYRLINGHQRRRWHDTAPAQSRPASPCRHPPEPVRDAVHVRVDADVLRGS